MLRDVGEGVVKSGDDGRVDIRYDLQPIDIQRLVGGAKVMVRAYFAAGARRVSTLTHPARFFDQEAQALDALDAVTEATEFGHVHASHPHGSCRMGPATGQNAGVVDENAQVHGTKGLFVMDGSIFPSTLGVNPQITIMALSQALSRRLVA
jgi:choline dehydrogenase-like flavoprotein